MDVGTIRSGASAAAAAVRHAAHPPAPARLEAASAALDALGTGPLQPTGRVAAGLEAGRLLRTGDPDRLDAAERVLREGTIDRSSAELVGTGMNGRRYRMTITDDATPGASPVWAVEKPAEAQAAQEELAWRLARALGIDHLVPMVARRADGAAWIEFREGRSLSQLSVTDVAQLDRVLTRSYLDDAALGLGPAEAAQAARIDRQLLQLLDYLLANNDRHLGNALLDARAGGKLTFLDFGHAGRGTANRGADLLRPSLRSFQGGAERRVDLDPAVVQYVRGRLDADGVRTAHGAVFRAPDIDTPRAGSRGARFIAEVNGPAFREGVVRRLEHVLAHGGYEHADYDPSNASLQLLRGPGGLPVRGLGAVRHQFAGLDGQPIF